MNLFLTLKHPGKSKQQQDAQIFTASIEMVKISDRQLALRYAMVIMQDRNRWKIRRFILDVDDSEEDEIDNQMLGWIRVVQSSRYINQCKNFVFNQSRFNHLLHEIRESRFQKLFRVTRSSFNRIVDLLGDSIEFKSTPGKLSKAPIAHHLLVLLYFLGTNGNACSNEHMASFFDIGSGTIASYVARGLNAVAKLRDTFIFWPNHIEACAISKRIETLWGFRHCIGFIDGTLFPFETKPTLHGEDYYSRKGCYAVAGQVICDDRGLVRDIYVGWPGSTHDNRVWRNCKIHKQSENYFSKQQYLLGDSAYKPCGCIIPAFKNLPNQRMPRWKEEFNTKLATARIKAEHCIGMLKGRFQYLKRIRKLMDGKVAMSSVIKIIVVSTILHNFLILKNDEIPASWMDLQTNCWCNADVRGCRSCFPAEGDLLYDDDEEDLIIVGVEKRDFVAARVLEGTQY